MIIIGDKVTFDPFQYIGGEGSLSLRGNVVGEVVDVNYGHKWFSVEYGDPKMRTSFNFADVGKDVTVIGRS